MAEESGFFNSVDGDRQYDMDDFANYFKQFLSTGVYHTDGDPGLRVTKLSGLQVNLSEGSAYIEGFMYRNTSDKSLTHASADNTNPRIDRIILRLDRGVNARSINAVIKQGEPSTSPYPPELQRDEVIYEIGLAQVRINAGSSEIDDVRDERLDTSVAGLVSSLITVPTDQFQQEWDEWFTGIKEGNPAMGGMTFYTGDTEPSNPSINDRWLDTND